MWGTSWFGGSGGQKRKDAPKKAILDLRQQLDMLQKRERHLESQMAKQDEIARDNVSTNKTGMYIYIYVYTGWGCACRGGKERLCVCVFIWANMILWLGVMILVARSALKRKKQHEHSLEQTNGQINMLEQQIYSIESANINQETLLAMKNASAAMKQIHGKMTMEDVDVTMYVLSFSPSVPTFSVFAATRHSPRR